MFAPVCSVLDVPIPPCKHLCLSAKAGCEDMMRKFGYEWPEILDCDKLQKVNNMCVGENRTQSAEVPSAVSSSSTTDASSSIRESDATMDRNAVERFRNGYECPHTMKVLSKTRRVFNFFRSKKFVRILKFNVFILILDIFSQSPTPPSINARCLVRPTESSHFSTRTCDTIYGCGPERGQWFVVFAHCSQLSPSWSTFNVSNFRKRRFSTWRFVIWLFRWCSWLGLSPKITYLVVRYLPQRPLSSRR